MSTVALDQLPLIGGALCLDFVNSIDPRHAEPQVDYLTGYDALLEWALKAGAIGPAETQRLAELAGERKTESRRVHGRAVRLREALYLLFAPATREQPGEAALSILNDELRRAAAALAVERQAGGYRLGWTPRFELERTIWPIARSAGELLTSPALRHVHECDGDGCGWLFLDTSKAGRRRWCSMSSCGNRAKSRRYRERARKL